MRVAGYQISRRLVEDCAECELQQEGKIIMTLLHFHLESTTYKLQVYGDEICFLLASIIFYIIAFAVLN